MVHKRLSVFAGAGAALVVLVGGAGCGASESDQPAAVTTNARSTPQADALRRTGPCRFDDDGNYVDPEACWAWRDTQPLEPAATEAVKPYDGPCAEFEDDAAFEECVSYRDDALADPADQGYPDRDPYQDRP